MAKFSKTWNVKITFELSKCPVRHIALILNSVNKLLHGFHLKKESCVNLQICRLKNNYCLEFGSKIVNQIFFSSFFGMLGKQNFQKSSVTKLTNLLSVYLNLMLVISYLPYLKKLISFQQQSQRCFVYLFLVIATIKRMKRTYSIIVFKTNLKKYPYNRFSLSCRYITVIKIALKDMYIPESH